MMHRLRIKIDLLRLILVIAVAAGLLVFGSVFYASSQVQKTQLIETTLENNYNYAKKLASSTDEFLRAAQQQMATTAKVVAKDYTNIRFLEIEAERLRVQTDSFNSVVFVSADGRIVMTSPQNKDLIGEQAKNQEIQEALRQRQPMISQPTLSTLGNLVIYLSYPIVSDQGEYLGLVGGTLYLRTTGALHRLLGEHYYRDGSSLYVVTKNKQLIYHPDPQKIGAFTNNSVLAEMISTGSGTVTRVNSSGQTMLAGYALIEASGWVVVAQRPLAAAIEPLDGLMQRVMLKTLPLGVLILILVWWGARKIATPLHLLADNARNMDAVGTELKIKQVRSWYFESYELKKALLFGMGLFKRSIDKLNKDVKTDPLTGLHNRRSLDAELTHFEISQTPFSVVSIDIDHFKHINDTYGHNVGDLVLKKLASLMQECSRVSDLACRVGGEEFLMLLPETDLDKAQQIAERLRTEVASTPMPHGGVITISLGVASWPSGGLSIADVLKHADEMLYQAKHAGRNRVEAYQP